MAVAGDALVSAHQVHQWQDIPLPARMRQRGRDSQFGVARCETETNRFHRLGSLLPQTPVTLYLRWQHGVAEFSKTIRDFRQTKGTQVGYGLGQIA